MADDGRRLQKVSRRFELIGRKPQLEPVPLREVLIQLRRYFEARLPSLRASSTIEIRVDVAADAPEVLGNATLLEWAFENLMKNAIDAMASEGGRIRNAAGVWGCRSPGESSRTFTTEPSTPRTRRPARASGSSSRCLPPG